MSPSNKIAITYNIMTGANYVGSLTMLVSADEIQDELCDGGVYTNSDSILQDLIQQHFDSQDLRVEASDANTVRKFSDYVDEVREELFKEGTLQRDPYDGCPEYDGAEY